jgi:hypothetical protein
VISSGSAPQPGFTVAARSAGLAAPWDLGPAAGRRRVRGTVPDPPGPRGALRVNPRRRRPPPPQRTPGGQ